MSNRESARLARRRAVDEAAREWQRHAVVMPWGDVYYETFEGECYRDYEMILRRALALPRPWVSGGQRPQPVRHSRAQRRRRRRQSWGCWCRRCARYIDAALPF